MRHDLLSDCASYQTEIEGLMANKRAPGKGGIPSLLHAQRARPALPEHER